MDPPKASGSAKGDGKKSTAAPPAPTPGGRKPSKKHRAHHAKVRVHLPPIESYEKDLEFPADGPGRVVVRLERLMGSDRVRLTDAKYMSTLLERLEEQEALSWTKRRVGRIKAERNRFRQLAIAGLTDPGPDMQDLYFHPVFRVNRVLKNLSKMDSNMTGQTPLDKLPPIVEIDPFKHDPDGKAFKFYPGHANAGEMSKYSREISASSTATNATGLEDRKSMRPGAKSMVSLATKKSVPAIPKATKSNISVLQKSMVSLASQASKATKAKSIKSAKSVKSTKSVAATEMQSQPGPITSVVPGSKVTIQAPAGDETESVRESVASAHKERTFSHFSRRASERLRRMTESINISEVPQVETMQREYGIPSDINLAAWEPYRDFLVDAVFSYEGENMLDGLYELSDDVLATYEREVVAADEFTTKLNRVMRGEMK